MGEEFLGNWRHQWSSMIMAASQYDLWYEGKPTNIGRDTVADQWGEHMMHTYQKKSGKTRQENTGEEF